MLTIPLRDGISASQVRRPSRFGITLLMLSPSEGTITYAGKLGRTDARYDGVVRGRGEGSAFDERTVWWKASQSGESLLLDSFLSKLNE